MSCLIPCTQNCRYQLDGMCTLERACQLSARPQPNELCLHFTPRSHQGGYSLSDVGDADELQPFRDG